MDRKPLPDVHFGEAGEHADPHVDDDEIYSDDEDDDAPASDELIDLLGFDPDEDDESDDEEDDEDEDFSDYDEDEEDR